MPRIHGLHRPFDPLQISSWVCLATLVLGYHILAVPLARALNTAALASFIVLFWALLIALIASVLRCSLADPSTLRSVAVAPLTSHRECSYCAKTVLSDTRHCRLCAKCVPGFDHHCRWLNTCIGQANYRAFAVVLGSVNAFLLVQIAALLVCVIAGLGRASLVSEAFAHSSSASMFMYSCVALSFLAALFAALIPVAHLTALHVYLSARGLTTYEWIVEGRERAKQRQELQQVPTAPSSLPDSMPSPPIALPVTPVPAPAPTASSATFAPNTSANFTASFLSLSIND